mmetsp:Transcript_101576/g.296089  ORF Transcript_101576/g.296089 Transcript_101576/m.296089 type:complete len:398 (-) Transcript_101576:304-1497(-)
MVVQHHAAANYAGSASWRLRCGGAGLRRLLRVLSSGPLFSVASILLPAEAPVQQRAQQARQRRAHEPVGEEPDLVWDVPAQQEEGQGVAAVVAVVREDVIRLLLEPCMQLLDVAHEGCLRPQSRPQSQTLCWLAEGGLAGQRRPDASQEVELKPKHHDAGVPDPLLCMPKQQGGQVFRKALGDIVVQQLHGLVLQASLPRAELRVRHAPAHVCAQAPDEVLSLEAVVPAQHGGHQAAEPDDAHTGRVHLEPHAHDPADGVLVIQLLNGACDRGKRRGPRRLCLKQGEVHPLVDADLALSVDVGLLEEALHIGRNEAALLHGQRLRALAVGGRGPPSRQVRHAHRTGAAHVALVEGLAYGDQPAVGPVVMLALRDVGAADSPLAPLHWHVYRRRAAMP